MMDADKGRRASSALPLKTVIGNQPKEADKPAPPKPQSGGGRKGA
jgi:hypothetical protein